MKSMAPGSIGNAATGRWGLQVNIEPVWRMSVQSWCSSPKGLSISGDVSNKVLSNCTAPCQTVPGTGCRWLKSGFQEKRKSLLLFLFCFFVFFLFPPRIYFSLPSVPCVVLLGRHRHPEPTLWGPSVCFSLVLVTNQHTHVHTTPHKYNLPRQLTAVQNLTSHFVHVRLSYIHFDERKGRKVNYLPMGSTVLFVVIAEMFFCVHSKISRSSNACVE